MSDDRDKKTTDTLKNALLVPAISAIVTYVINYLLVRHLYHSILIFFFSCYPISTVLKSNIKLINKIVLGIATLAIIIIIYFIPQIDDFFKGLFPETPQKTEQSVNQPIEEEPVNQLVVERIYGGIIIEEENNYPITLNLIFNGQEISNESKITYEKYKSNIKINGNLTNNTLVLQEIVKNRPNAIIIFNDYDVTKEKLRGTWIDLNNKDRTLSIELAEIRSQ